MKSVLMKIYQRLYAAYGPRHWWPGDTVFEVMVGAILTQNTSWRNVEKAIQNLKKEGVLNPKKMVHLRRADLASLIRPSGYFRIKADRLKNFLAFFFEAYGGSFRKMGREETEVLRKGLLSIRGIGPETADSMLLYGLQKPVFVVDAYTRRILSRHGIVGQKASYEEIQQLFMDHLPSDEKLFNEYHALLVHLGKEVCRKAPKCGLCPLEGFNNSGFRIQGVEGSRGQGVKCNNRTPRLTNHESRVTNHDRRIQGFKGSRGKVK